jgi:hypothetical protein
MFVFAPVFLERSQTAFLCSHRSPEFAVQPVHPRLIWRAAAAACSRLTSEMWLKCFSTSSKSRLHFSHSLAMNIQS